MKAHTAQQALRLEDIPNIGLALANDLRLLNIHHPHQLRHQDAFALYQQLNRATQQRQDPCVLDTFMAAVNFMSGAARSHDQTSPLVALHR